MTGYQTETGFYVLRDAEGRVCGKANVPVGTHPVPDYVDPAQSEDVDSAGALDDYEIHDDYTDTP